MVHARLTLEMLIVAPIMTSLASVTLHASTILVCKERSSVEDSDSPVLLKPVDSGSLNSKWSSSSFVVLRFHS